MKTLFNKGLSYEDDPIFVAEISCNHNGHYEDAIELIGLAKASGADAVKIQVYTADEMTLPSSGPDFMIHEGPWKGRNLYELYQNNKTPFEWLPGLVAHAKNLNVPLFASVFGPKSLAIMEEVGCPAYKIASSDANDPYLVGSVVRTGKPVIVSTGMMSDEELDSLSRICPPERTILMHCVAAYPCRYQDANLWRIDHLRSWGYSVGFSDHTVGIKATQTAVALGARIIERHFGYELNFSDDSTFSDSPQFFALNVKNAKEVMKGLRKSADDAESSSRQFRRSIYTKWPIKAGEDFTEDNLVIVRPSFGLPPARMVDVMTCKAARDIEAGTALKEDMIDESELKSDGTGTE